MNKIRRIAIVIGILMVVAAGAVVAALALGGRGREVRQSDGTVLRLEKVSFGSPESIMPGGGRWQRLKEEIATYLPKNIASKLIRPKPTGVTPMFTANLLPGSTTNLKLHVWMTRINTASGKYQDVDVHSADLVDADGCAICCVTVTGEDPGLLGPQPLPVAPVNERALHLPISATAKPASVVRFSFETFPRREKNLKLRVYGRRREVLAEYVVPNPAPLAPLPATPTSSLPVSTTNRGVVFKLTGMTIRSNIQPQNSPAVQVFQPPRPPGVMFSFEFTENGVVNDDWATLATELTDSAGNHSPVLNGYPYILCPKDPAWHLEVKFAGKEDVSKRVSLRDLAIPARDTAIGLSTNLDLAGTLIQILGVGGIGRTAFSNGIPVAASSTPGPRGLNNLFRISSNRGNRGNALGLDITSPNPYVLLKLGGFPDDDRITVCAIDEQGRRYFGQEGGAVLASMPLTGTLGRGQLGDVRYLRPVARNLAGGRSGPAANDVGVLLFDLPSNAKVVDLEFRMHRLRTVTFDFKPPDH